MPNFPAEYPSVAEFIEAIEKNGWEQGRTSLFEYNGQLPIRACAMGQALLNLGIVKESEITSEYRAEKIERECVDWLNKNKNIGKFYANVWEMNDHDRLSPPEIAARLRMEYEVAGS